MKLITILLFSGLVSLSSCKHDPIITTGPNNPADSSVFCFQEDVLPIFQINCAKSGCHDDATGSDGFRATSYNSIRSRVKPGDLSDSEIWKVLHEDDAEERMPPPPNPPLTQAQLDILRKWIMEGALNEPCTK